MRRVQNSLTGRTAGPPGFAGLLAFLCLALAATPARAQIGTVGFDRAAYPALEYAGFVTVTVIREVSTNDAFSFVLATSDDTATNGVHYTGFTNAFAMAQGQRETNILIALIDDALLIGDRAFNVRIEGLPVGAGIGLTNAVVNIIDDEAFGNTAAGQFRFTSFTYYVTDREGSAPPPNEDRGSIHGALITVTRENGAKGKVHVDYSTVDPGVVDTNDLLTAIPGTDFVPVSGTLTFDDYQMSRSFVVPILRASGSTTNLDTNGPTPTNLKQFGVRITNPRPAAGEDPNDIIPTLGFPNVATVEMNKASFLRLVGTNFVNGFSFERANYRVREDGGTVVVAVLLPGGGPGCVDVDITDDARLIRGAAIQAGSACCAGFNSDYTPPTAFANGVVRLTFGQGVTRQTFSITIVNDGNVEFNEDIRMQLVCPPPGTCGCSLGNQIAATATITFDDPPAGAVDTGWNPDGGGAQNPPGNANPGANNVVHAISLQPDGKAVIGGPFTGFNAFPRNRVARLNANGFLDLGFDPGTGANGSVNAVLAYPAGSGANDGKILIGGGFTAFNGNLRYGIARLNANGSLDFTFNPGNGVDGTVFGLALQADGKVVIAGDFTQVNGVARGYLARLNDDGSLDVAFDPVADGIAWAVALDSAQRVVVGGDFVSIDGEFRPGIARLAPDGSVDLGFNPGGGADGTVFALAAQADDRVLLGGAFTTVDFVSRGGIARLNTDGSVDTNFDPGRGVNDDVYSIVLQPDGRILVGGIFTEINWTRRIGLARLFPNGYVDTSFLDAAFNQFAGLINDFSFEPNNYINAIALQSDGDVLIAGSFQRVGGGGGNTRDGTRSRFHVARLHGGESPGPGNLGFASPTYSADEHSGGLSVGISRINSGGIGSLSARAAASNNTAVAGQDYFAVVQTVSSGNTLGIGIIEDTLIEGNETIDLFLFNPSASLVLGGETLGVNPALHRTRAQVTIVDNDFLPGRFVFSAPTYSRDETGMSVTITVQRVSGDSGAVSVDYFTMNGTASGGDYTARQGTLTFAAGQTTRTITIPLFDDTTVEPDETVFLVLTNATGGAAIEFSSVDPSFDPGTGANGPVRALAIYNNLTSRGKVVMAGDFTQFNGTNRSRILRLGTDGAADPAFPDSTAANGPVNAVAIDNIGRIVLGGSFSAVNGAPRNNLAVLGEDGSLDPLFDASVDPSVGPDDTVRALATLGDGSILMGGDFTAFSGQAQYLHVARVDSDGLLDGSLFSESAGPDGPVYALAPLTNGQFYVGGSFSDVGGVTLHGIALLNADGRPSGEFNPPTIPGAVVYSIAVQADGRLVVAGSNLVAGGSAHLIRLNRSGSLDTSFSPGTGPDAPVHAVAVHSFGVPTDRIVIGGAFTSVNGVGRNRLARLLPDGPVDDTFAPAPGANDQVRALLIQADNKVVFGGDFTMVNGLARGRIARLSPSIALLTIIDNDLDSGRASFTALGYATNESAGAALVTVKRTGGNVGVLSVQVITSDGTATNGLDYTGATNTVTWSDGDTAVKSVAIALTHDTLIEPIETVNLRLANPSVAGALGNITNATLSIENDDFAGMLGFSAASYTVTENSGTAVITVTRTGGTAGPAFVRFATVPGGSAINGTDYDDTNGLLSFGDGESSKSFPITIRDDAPAVADGDRTVFLALGSATNAALGTLTNAVLTIVDNESQNIPAGAVDTTFNPPGGANAGVYALAVQADGRILAAGDFTQMNNILRSRIARLTDLAALDPSFNPGVGPNAPVRALALQGDGRILVGGFFDTFGGINRGGIARLNPDGSVDTFFDPGAGADNPVYALALTAEGRVVIGGAFTRVNGVTRPNVAMLNTNGALLASFNVGVGPNDTVFAVAIQSDGRILIGGDFTTVNNVSRPRVARLNRDGSLDTGFDVGTGPDGTVRALAVQSDGKVLLGGSFTSVNGTNRNYLARLNRDGSLDASFLASDGGGDNAVYALALQVDERIIVGGEFTRFNGVTRNRVTRLNQDGSTDVTINFGTGANAFVAAVASESDSQVLIAGGFTQVNGQPRGRIARLHGGSITGAGQLEFSAPNFDAPEYTNGVVTVRRIGGTAGDVQVRLSSFAGTALAGEDYRNVTNTLVFPPGEVLGTVIVAVTDDNFAENPETVNLALDQVVGATLGPQPVATLTIVSDDSLLSFDRQNYREPEDAPSGRATIPVRRDFATNSVVSVTVGTTTNFPVTTVRPAVPGVDFGPTNGVLTFGLGETMKNFFVPIFDNATNDGSKALGLTLSAPTALPPSLSAGLGSNSTAILTIVDNEFYPGDLNFTATSYTVQELNTNTVITVRRDNGSSGIVAVDYRATAGTATAGADFVEVSGTLAFADGQNLATFVVPIKADLRIEDSENVILTLSNPTGGARLGTNSQVALVIVNVGGIPDPGSVTPFNLGSGANNLVRAVAVQTNGALVIGGAFTSFNGTPRNFIARLDANGALDPSFNPGSGADGLVASVAVQPDGRLLLSGAFLTVNGVSRVRVARLNANGSVDTGFALPGGANATVYAVAPHRDGVILGGLFDNQGTIGLARLNSDGTPDPAFNAGLTVNGAVYALAVQTNDQVLLAGDFTTVRGTARGRIARLNADGTLDGAFGTAAGANAAVFAVAIATNNQIVIGGLFTSVHAVAGLNRVARLNSDGSLDTAFAPLTGADDIVYGVAAQPDGKVLLGGDFTHINGVPRNRIARMNADGSLDSTFNVGAGADSTVYGVALQPDLKVVIVGDFTVVDTQPRSGVAQLFGGDPFQQSQFVVTAVTIQPDGDVLITLATTPGSTYALESSTDFVTWTELATVTATGTTLNFTDTNPGPGPRFYRARMVP